MAALLRHAPIRALRRSPGLSALMVATLAFGLAVWLTTYAVARSFEQDPMRDVAGLFRVELVRHTEIREILRGTDMGFVSVLPSVVLSPGEVEELSRSGIAARSAAVTSAELAFQGPGEAPGVGMARFTGREAFALFGIRLAAGRVFDEQRRELLISEPDARRWFGSAGDAPGKTLRVGGEEWQVAGVVAAGAAAGRRMHVQDGVVDPSLWLPFDAATRLGVLPVMRHPVPRTTAAANGDFAFASLWLELRGADDARRYRAWLEQWSAAHPQAGEPRVRRYQEWSGFLGAPPAYQVLEIFGAATLAACCLTLARLFHTRNRLHRLDIALRRAVGASRRSLLGEALLEGLAIVAAGVLAGLLFGALSLQLLELAMPVPGIPVGLRLSSAAMGIATGLVVGLGSALLPAFRATAEPPARGLRAT